MNILIRILIIKLMLLSTLIYCQNNTLDNFRIHNCKKKCKIFSKELVDKTNNNNSTPFIFSWHTEIFKNVFYKKSG